MGGTRLVGQDKLEFMESDIHVSLHHDPRCRVWIHAGSQVGPMTWTGTDTGLHSPIYAQIHGSLRIRIKKPLERSTIISRRSGEARELKADQRRNPW